MGTLGTRIPKGLACVAAALTLITGVPHFECRCPDGEVKPFCLGATPAPAGCCCGGACCSGTSGGCCRGPRAAPARHARKGCCCGRDRAAAQGGHQPDSQCLARASGCVKALAEPAPLLLSTAKKAAVGGASRGAYLAAGPSLACPRAAGTPEGAYAWGHSLAPPRDRLLLLCRLLI